MPRAYWNQVNCPPISQSDIDERYILKLSSFCLISAFLIILLQGCGTYTKYESSRPEISEQEVWTHTIKLDDLELNIRPYNDIVTFEMVQSIVYVPIYIETEDRSVYQRDNEFRVMLGYHPLTKGFSLDAERIVLLLDGKEFSADVLNEWTHPVSRWGNELYGYCGKPIPAGYHRISGTSAEPRGETEMWHCYELLFDVQPPSPSERFAIFVNGMKKNEVPYEIPVIWFEKYERTDIDSIP